MNFLNYLLVKAKIELKVRAEAETGVKVYKI